MFAPGGPHAHLPGVSYEMTCFQEPPIKRKVFVVCNGRHPPDLRVDARSDGKARTCMYGVPCPWLVRERLKTRGKFAAQKLVVLIAPLVVRDSRLAQLDLAEIHFDQPGDCGDLW